jgi:hypothetical protein
MKGGGTDILDFIPVQEPVDLCLVPCLGPRVEVVLVIPIAPFQSVEVVLEGCFGEMVLADGICRLASRGWPADDMISVLARGYDLASLGIIPVW